MIVQVMGLLTICQMFTLFCFTIMVAVLRSTMSPAKTQILISVWSAGDLYDKL